MVIEVTVGTHAHSYQTQSTACSPTRGVGKAADKSGQRRRSGCSPPEGPRRKRTHLRQGRGEVIAVLVHQVVGVALVLLPQLLHDFLDVILQEVRAP